MSFPTIEKADHRDEPWRRRIVDLLAPHEAHALFILGNLQRDLPGSHLYVALDGDRPRGVLGYYEGPRSMALWAADQQAAAALAAHAYRLHRELRFVCGVGDAVLPALDELRRSDARIAIDEGTKAFFELQGAPPVQAHEGAVRPMASGDRDAVARLLRILADPRAADLDGPASAAEIAALQVNALRMVLEIDGTVVSTACTNGRGLHAFQILGVVTDPRHRGRGYARSICAALIRRMLDDGAERCVLFTEPDNAAAIRCYETLGFRRSGTFHIARITAAR